jgi:hypothetical protein
MKLQYVENEYYLTDNGRTIATTDKELLNDMIGAKKLSKQNCDEILGVVDVEKYVDEYAEEWKYDERIGFRDGFNKAMELNKDKLFTVEDMEQMWEIGRNYQLTGDIDIHFKRVIDEFKQPKEIQVELEMNIAIDGHTVLGYERDENGCIVLKKK